ncbi:hypothetical protein [Streptomyces sp. KL116D]
MSGHQAWTSSRAAAVVDVVTTAPVTQATTRPADQVTTWLG